MTNPNRHPKGANDSQGGKFAISVEGRDNIPTAGVSVATVNSANKNTTPAGNDKITEIFKNFQEKYGRAPVIGLDLDGTTASMVGGLRKVMAAKNEVSEKVEVDCPQCNGTGELAWRADPSDPTGQNPMQVQCPCITGKVLVSKDFAREIGAIGELSSEELVALYPEPDKYAMWTGEKAWFQSKEDFLSQFQSAERDGLYRNLPAYEGAPEVINMLLANGFKIKAVTARSEDYNADTAHWLKSQGIPVDEILHPGHTKHQVEGIDIFFDDAPGVISGLVEHERKVIIFDQAWNENEPVDHLDHTRRVSGWGIDGLSQALDELL